LLNFTHGISNTEETVLPTLITYEASQEPTQSAQFTTMIKREETEASGEWQEALFQEVEQTRNLTELRILEEMEFPGPARDSEATVNSAATEYAEAAEASEAREATEAAEGSQAIERPQHVEGSVSLTTDHESGQQNNDDDDGEDEYDDEYYVPFIEVKDMDELRRRTGLKLLFVI
jgi:hypothetical protein